MHTDLVSIITQAWENPTLRTSPTTQAAIGKTLELLDQGALRIASPQADQWVIHEWVKQAILLYFSTREATPIPAGDLRFFDKVPVKTQLEGVRVVPPGIARYGSFLAPGAILMAGYVNIGAHIETGTMIDINAAIGSCAQIGKRVHISAGAVIGGVLEPLQAHPVIIEDDAFVGANATVVEGVHVGKGAVIAAGVTLTASTPLIDVTGEEEMVHKGVVPPYALVVPGTRTKAFSSGNYQLACALMIGMRTPETDKKIALNAALRQR